MSASEISFISPSTIIMLSIEAATIKSISDSSNISAVGFRINSPLMRPTLTSEIGPPKGMSETANAAEAARAASVSGITVLSEEIRLIII